MAGSDERASIPLPAPAAAPLRWSVTPCEPQVSADQLEIRGWTCVDQVAGPTVIAKDRVQAAAALEHQTETVLAGVGIFPAEQALARLGRAIGPKDDKQAARGGNPARESSAVTLRRNLSTVPVAAVDRTCVFRGPRAGLSGLASEGRDARLGQTRTRPSPSLDEVRVIGAQADQARVCARIVPRQTRRGPSRFDRSAAVSSLPRLAADSSSFEPVERSACRVSYRFVPVDRGLGRDPVEIVDEAGEEFLGRASPAWRFSRAMLSSLRVSAGGMHRPK